jgi:hypothetical protein
MMGARAVWVQLNRAFEFFFRAGPIPVVQMSDNR